MKKKGFTLTELLVTIAIIGIFAVAVVPEVISFQDRTKRARALNDIQVYAEAIKRFMSSDTDPVGTVIPHHRAEIIDTTLDQGYDCHYKFAQALWLNGLLNDEFFVDPWSKAYCVNINAPHFIISRDGGGKVYIGEYTFVIQSLGRDGINGTPDDIRQEFSDRIK